MECFNFNSTTTPNSVATEQVAFEGESIPANCSSIRRENTRVYGSPSLSSVIRELSSQTLILKSTEYREQLFGDLMKNHPMREVLNEAVRMSIHHMNGHEVNRLFKVFRQMSDKKYQKIIRHARNVALGIDEHKKDARNSNRKVVRILYELEQMEACAVDYEAQGLFDFNMNINHKVDDRVTNLMQSMEKGISTFFGGQNMASLKTKLIRFVLCIFECISNSSLASKMRMLTAFLIDFVDSSFEWMSCSLQEYASVLAQVLKRPFSKKKDIQIEIEESYDDCLEAQMDYDVAKKCIQGTMVVLASMLSLKPPRGDIKMSSTAKLNAISKSIKSVESIWKFITEMFGEALNNILYEMGCEVPENALAFINEDIVKWMKDIDLLPDSLDIKINGDYSLAEEVIDLKKKGDDFFNDLQRMRASSTIMTLFQNKYNYIRNYAKKAAPHFFNDKMREAPFVIHLHGNSGIGKSTVQNFLVNELMKKLIEDGKITQFDHGKDIYVRNNDQDHWDGYHNQPVVFFDDFMQTRDTESRTGELNELIRVKNTTAYPLKMASLEDKGNTRFTSRLVVISSNLDFATNKEILRQSIECPTAIQRRIDVSARVTILKKHCDSLTGKLDVFTLADRTKRFDDSIYGFVCEGKAMNYPMFVNFCYNRWNEINTQDKALIEVLPGWTGSQIVPQQLNMEDLHLEELEAQFKTVDQHVINERKRVDVVTQEHQKIAEILKIFGIVAQVKGHYLSLPNADLILDGLIKRNGKRPEMKSAYTQTPKKEKYEIEVQVDIDGEDELKQRRLLVPLKVGVMDKSCSAKPEIRTACVQIGDGVTRESRNTLAKEGKKYFYSNGQSARRALKMARGMNYTHIVEGEGIYTLKEWENKMKKDSQLEAQYGFFSRNEVSAEDDKITESELFLINYAIAQEDEEPVSDWKQAMKDKFYELKEKTKVKSSECYDRLRTEAKKQYDRFMELNPWYKVGLGIISVLGFVGTIMATYNFCTKDDKESEAAVSGDHRTMMYSRRYAMKKQSEASVSGDHKTARYVRRYAKEAEATVSGDQKTVMYQRKYARIGAEAAIDRKLYDGQLFNEDRSVEAQQSSDPNAHALMGNLIYNNVAKVTCHGCTINGLFLCDTILMVPRHMMLLVNDGDEFMIKTRCHTHIINIDECEYREDPQMDVAFIRCPNRIGSYVSLVKHFHTFQELEKVNVNVGVLCGVRDTKDGTTMIMMMAHNLRVRGRVDYPARMGDQVLDECYIIKGFEYKSQTMRGDCGAPLIALHNGLTKKILGIHTAGARDLGISNCLTQDYIESWIGKFHQVIKHDIPLLNSDPLEAHSAVKEDDKVEVLGMVDKKLQFRTVMKSQITESPLHGIFEVQTKPAMLRREGDIDPLRIALQTQFVEQISFPQDVVDTAVEDLKMAFISYKTAYTGRGLLSNHSVLNGDVGDPWIKPMNMKTSPGFPYINIKRTLGGKFDFLCGDVGNYVLDEFTSDLVRLREKQAAIGEIPITLFCDTLKDEKRAIEKVNEGKTRVFNTAPFDLSFLVRKYFGNFIAHVMENHVYGECSVGVDPHSDKWTLMYEHLDVHGEKWIAGDFSKYDKTLSFQLICGALDVINAWYNDEHDFVRKTLFYTMFNATHLTGSTVYRVHQGNPSGIPLTVIINSLVNSLLSRITYILISKNAGYRSDMSSFHKFVRVKNYGDDNIGKVSKRCHWYNMISIKNCLAEYGIKYTPPTKGEVVCEYLEQQDVTYLKRGFVKRGSRMWAPLDMMSIQEMLMWTRTGGPLSPEESTEANFGAAMREMVHYGKQDFNKFQKYVLLEAARRELYLKSFTFEILEKEMTEGYACDPDQMETDYIFG